MQKDKGRGIEEIAAELQEKRESLRQSQAVADKVPGLEREIERLNGLVEKLRSLGAAGSSREAELEHRIGELESELRGEAELEKQAQKAEADRADALAEQKKAEEELVEARECLVQVEADLQNAQKEIERLKGHEEHTNLFRELLKLTKGL